MPWRDVSGFARRALLSAAERSLNALVKKGSRRCWKAVRDVDQANADVGLAPPADQWLAGEVRAVLRVRCTLCPFRENCKAPLTC
jgi:hypothetical protein